MLYLPAGWFHCVTSQSLPGDRSHMALNYWFHPPDNCESDLAGFAHPYSSDYWPHLWHSRMQTDTSYTDHLQPAGQPEHKLGCGRSYISAGSTKHIMTAVDQTDLSTEESAMRGPDPIRGSSSRSRRSPLTVRMQRRQRRRLLGTGRQQKLQAFAHA